MCFLQNDVNCLENHYILSQIEGFQLVPTLKSHVTQIFANFLSLLETKAYLVYLDFYGNQTRINSAVVKAWTPPAHGWSKESSTGRQTFRAIWNIQILEGVVCIFSLG